MNKSIKKICFLRYGCGAHKNAFQQLLKNLEGKYEQIANPLDADVIIQYFCAHTSYVIKSICSQMKLLKTFKKLRPNTKFIVCGCAVEVIDFQKLYPWIDFCCKKENIVKNILQFLQEPYITEDFNISVSAGSANIVISTGCNRRCSFCKWKYLPMNLVSSPMEKVVLETKRAIDSGANLIYLFAHNSTQYGIDLYNKPMLLQLLQALLNNTTEAIFYLTGVTVADLSFELCEFIQHEERIYGMQLESQSASNLVRSKMNLGSNVQELESVIDAFSNKCFITNFMIGHPYEGEAEFQETLDFIKRKKLWNSSFGTYQNTPGIVSAEMPQISEEEKDDRSKRFYNTILELRKEFFDNLIGRTIIAYLSYDIYHIGESLYMTFNGKTINCIISVKLPYSSENDKMVNKIKFYHDIPIKLVQVINYFDFEYKQQTILKGELVS